MNNDYIGEINIAKKALIKILSILKKNYLKKKKYFYLR